MQTDYAHQPQVARDAKGAFATFYYLRKEGMSARAAHTAVSQWAHEKRSAYAPNPLCMATRREMNAYYDSQRYQGD